MPAAIQMLAALALLMIAVVALVAAVVIGAVFARMTYAAVRYVVKLVNATDDATAAATPGTRAEVLSTNASLD